MSILFFNRWDINDVTPNHSVDVFVPNLKAMLHDDRGSVLQLHSLVRNDGDGKGQGAYGDVINLREKPLGASGDDFRHHLGGVPLPSPVVKFVRVLHPFLNSDNAVIGDLDFFADSRHTHTLFKKFLDFRNLGFGQVLPAVLLRVVCGQTLC